MNEDGSLPIYKHIHSDIHGAMGNPGNIQAPLHRARALFIRLLLAVLLTSSPGAWAGNIEGTLGAVGSDTMAGLMLRWGEALVTRHPDVRLQFQASGSASAPPALLAGTTRLGPMSRRMTAEEHQAFEKRYGYPLLELKVALDALVVAVHRHNPLRQLNLAQLDAIFSSTRACGEQAPLRRWQAFPATLDWPYGKIALHGRNLASGTYGLFRQRVLCGGEFRRDISEYPGSSAVIAAVGESPGAMGYAAYNHLTPMVHPLGIAEQDSQAVLPTEEAIQSGRYPLSRFLYLYVNLPPNETLPAAERAFIELILSDEGQRIARAAGFVPLSAPTLKAQELSGD
ncbi:phosphate ABC transporter substrate-binding protein [Vreelandella rituensis]|nr:phosphate ABC transporter substrate-binding protein [Halomonas rituensis]